MEKEERGEGEGQKGALAALFFICVRRTYTGENYTKNFKGKFFKTKEKRRERERCDSGLKGFANDNTNDNTIATDCELTNLTRGVSFHVPSFADGDVS